MIRLGLCCIFKKEKIFFRRTTVQYLLSLKKIQRELFLSSLVKDNCNSLLKATEYCLKHEIGDFRISSQIFPCKSHPKTSYKIENLKDAKEIFFLLNQAKKLKEKKDFRYTFHPDQFVVLSSNNKKVVENSIQELLNHDELSSLVGADLINIHLGGSYGNKKEAKKRFKKHFSYLPKNLQKIISLENDDKIYSPLDLIDLCLDLKIPLVYDVHHHRCLKDDLSIEEATNLSLKSFRNKEPLFHLSSPKYGYKSKKSKEHHDYIRINDFPMIWKNIPKLTIEIEAKAKELAIFRLQKALIARKVLTFNLPFPSFGIG